jgi:hypothetical protein
MKIYCCCCGRQVFDGSYSTDRTGPSLGARDNFGNTVFCGDCASELDENGNFEYELSRSDFILHEEWKNK